MTYRHEHKYLVSTNDLVLLRSRIKNLLKRDFHQRDDSGYLITSLYFDDTEDHCLKSTVDGVDIRHKYRLRIYNHDSDTIKLERKSKICGLTSKKTVAITQNECQIFMQGRIPAIEKASDPDKERLLCQMKIAGMQPKCIVQYNREVFVYPVGNVRITFDENICCTEKITDFLNDHISAIPVLDTDTHVLEVKYDDCFPRFIKDVLDIEKLRRTSLSKYVCARNTIRECGGKK